MMEEGGNVKILCLNQKGEMGNMRSAITVHNQFSEQVEAVFCGLVGLSRGHQRSEHGG